MVETSWNTAGRALGIGSRERPSGAGSRPVMAELAPAMAKGHEPIRPMTLGTMVTLASNAPKPQCQSLSPKTAAAPPQTLPHSHPSRHQPYPSWARRLTVHIPITLPCLRSAHARDAASTATTRAPLVHQIRIKPQKCVRGRPARRCTTWRRAGRHSATMRPGGPRYGAVDSAFRGGRVSENHGGAPGRGSWWGTAGACIRQTESIECDPEPADCAKLLNRGVRNRRILAPRRLAARPAATVASGRSGRAPA